MQKEIALISNKSYIYQLNLKAIGKSFFSPNYFLLILLFTLLGNLRVHAQLPTDFQKVELLTGLSNATTMQFAPDGRIFILDRYGEVIIYKTNTQTSISAGTVPVFHEFEDGLLGITFDPDFISNSHIYLHYAVQSVSMNRVSRFTMNGDSLDLNSEIVIIEWPTQRTLSFHSGGDMAFDSQGNLYIAVGDNTDHGNYGALNEGNLTESAEKSSSNTNDLRGKILRITPQPNGTYTIPAGNLFPSGTPNTRPEIYVMGARNPYRIFVDKENTDWLFWGEVGPDANAASSLGPEGLDEMNLVKTAGNYGWPYFSGVDNDAYQIPYKTPSPFYNDPNAPVNTSTWNTGANTLPPAKPAWLEFFHKSYFAGPRYYHDGTLSDQQRLPIEFDDAFFYYDFNTSKIWVVKMDSNGTILSNEQMAPSVFPSAPKGFIDMEIGSDGHMYILEYGTGCCPQNVGTGKLVRVDYTGVISNSPPAVVIGTNVTSGSLPLTVNFSSAGTIDPNGDTPLTYAWDFQSDGTVDSTQENPTFVFNTAGTFDVQLKVDDSNGGVGVQNITIYAGNNAATFTFNSPVDGGFMDWNDDINFDLTVNDQEDGSTSNGIDCNDVQVVASLGHLNHFHDGATMDGCQQILTLDPGSHDIDGEMDIFYVLNANYTDQGGLTAFEQLILHPKRKEAEFYIESSAVTKIANTDVVGGGSEAIRVDHGGNIGFSGRNLLNINSIKYRVAAAAIGGTIEFRIDSPSGPLLATTNVPITGSSDNWIDVESSFIDPGGKHDLFFIFKNNAGQQDIFDLNYVEFIGPGVSIDNSPPEVNQVVSESSITTSVEFSEYVTQATAQQISNYSIDNGITISSALLQPNKRTVVLTHDGINAGTSYNITVGNVQNLSGLSIVQNSYPLSIFDPIRINVGGPQVTTNGDTFIADQYSNGGSLFTKVIPIGNTTDDTIYQTERFKNFTYEIPLPISGAYDVRLHFAELYFGVGSGPGGVGSRVFNVSIEGNPVLVDLDISAEVGPATALIKEFNDISVTDGFATIQFSTVVENPKVSAIEILSAETVNITPTIAINSPSNGSNVNQPFDVSFTIENWEIQEGGTHMRYYIDGVMVGPHYSYGPVAIDDLSLGAHTIRLELYEVGHIPTGTYDEVTVNVTNQTVCNSGVFPDQWQVHELQASELPYRSVYILPQEDLDGDGLKDIVTGGWWYKNPGSASGNWVRQTVGGSFKNVAHIYDFDNDGDLDLLGTTGAYTGADMAWAQNDGVGNFTVRTNIPSGNTNYSEPFLAGIAGGIYQIGGAYQMAINWNGAESTGSPVQMLTVPADPVNTQWTLENLSPDSLGEDIKQGDIDGDGDLDLFQSSNWLRNEGNGNFTTFNTGISYVSTPDRAQLADFDGDGDLDAVVGQLSLGTSNTAKTEFAWFEAPANPTQNWIKHILATDINGSLSVFTSDIDFDGDEDIIVGEWKGSNRLIVFQNDLCNSGTWIRKTINAGGTGFDHHDGAQVIDIDNDGDLDIVSIGWDNIVPRIFENKSVVTNSDPIADADEDKNITLPTSSITLNGSGSDPDGGSVTFLWTQETGPSTAQLSGVGAASLNASNLEEGDYVFRLTVTDDENDTTFDEVTVSVSPEPTTGNFALHINTGGSEVGFNGETFVADVYFDTGNKLDRPQTGLPEPYQSMRFSRSQEMSYDIPLEDGEYTVNLYFAELWFGATGGGSGGAGSRVFDVSIEGQLAEDNLDVFAEAGADAMLLKSHTVTVSGGVLNIDFDSRATVGGNRHPIINAIEILGNGNNTIEPIVDAGSNQVIVLPATTSVTFNGSANDPDGGTIVNYDWTQISGPNAAVLSGDDTTDLTVTGLAVGSYIFRLTVMDEDDETGFDEVTLVVQTLGGTDPPIVNSGQDQNLTLPTNNIILNGSGSDPDGGSVSFLWTQQDGPSTAQLSGVSTASLNASNLEQGDYIFRLTVTDDENDTTFDEVTVSVSPEPTTGNFALHINTGGSEVGFNGETFVADVYFDTGNKLDRPQTGLPEPYQSMRFSRSQEMSYDIPLEDGEYTVNLYFAELWFGATGGGSGGAGSRVFDVSIEGQLAEDNLDVFAEAGADAMLLKSHTVTVSGGVLNIDFDSRATVGGNRHPIINAIEILGNGNNTIEPIVDAGSNQVIVLPATTSVTFNGSANDPDGGTIVNYDWTQISGPNAAVLSGDDTMDLTVTGLAVGSYIFRLTVMDEDDETGFDEVTLVVQTLGGTDPPIVNSGQDQNITLPTSSITLNGQGSDPDGGSVNFLWTQQDGPSTAQLSGVSTASLNASNLEQGDYVFRLTVTDDENDTTFDEVTVSVLPAVTNNFALRINTGGTEVDYNGETFVSDTYFDTGRTLDRPQTGLPEPFQSFRYSRSQQMSYDIPVPDGEYIVNLHFAELWFGATGGGSGGVGSRVFDVSIEGISAEDNLDVFAEAGANAMLVKAFVIAVNDGVLNIDFDSRDAVGGNRHPIINAIEILADDQTGSGKLAIGKKQSENEMSIYPNQATTFVTASFEQPTEVIQILVFDMIGRLIRSYNPYEIENRGDYTIDVNLYQQGAYIIKMVDNKGLNFQKQILIKR